MKALAALAIVVAGVVAGFAIYAFGWQEGGRESDTASARSRHIFTIRQGDIVRVPATATRCEASHEGGIPNLFCTRTQRGRYQVVFWKDEVQVYDLARHGEPMVATFVVPAEMKRRSHPQRPDASVVVPLAVSRAIEDGDPASTVESRRVERSDSMSFDAVSCVRTNPSKVDSEIVMRNGWRDCMAA